MAEYNHEAVLSRALKALQDKNLSEAARLAERATENRPNDAEGWSILGLALGGQSGVEALQKAAAMEPGEPRWQLHLGKGLTLLGDYQGAEAAYAKASQLSRGHPEAMKAWGNSLLSLERFPEAVRVFQSVLQAQPSTEVWIKAGDALIGAKDTINAAKAYERAYAADQRPLEMSGKLAELHLLLNQYDQAEVFINEILQTAPNDPDGGLMLANIMRWRGDHEKALEIQQKFWRDNQTHSGLIAALLDDRDEDVLEAAFALVDDLGADLQGRRRVSFSLARYFDRAKDEERAWEYALKANGLYDDGITYDGGAEHRTQLGQALAAYNEIAETPPSEQKMIYVIGPPRCGGSLLQTILCQPDGIASVGERGALLSWIMPSLGDIEKLKHITPQLAASDLAGMAKASGAANIFVDKTSPHIVVAGLLSKIHARARFVLPVRSRGDMIVSMFFHDFPPEFAYTRSVQGIIDYLAFQDEAAKAWRDAGLNVIEHNHDAFIEDPETAGKALFEALGLPWSPEVLNTDNSSSVVRTFSARQVRGGVSKKFSGRGERYAKYIE